MNNDGKKIDVNTHSYDGTVGSYFETFVKEFKEFKKKKALCSLEEVCQLLQKAATTDVDVQGDSKARAQVLKAVKMLCNPKDGANTDGSNKLTVGVMLPYVWYAYAEYFDKSGKKMFWEQIADIPRSGPCAQGRTTRLWQILSCLQVSECSK